MHQQLLFWKKLAVSAKAFAIYRLPNEEEPRLIVQTDGEVQTYPTMQALPIAPCFVMAPFVISSSHPVYVIQPQLVAKGWQEIKACLKRFPDASDADASLLSVIPQLVNYEEYTSLFASTQQLLKQQKVKKIVLSRCLHIAIDDLAIEASFQAACESYKEAMVYLSYTPQQGLWMGCTPEILLQCEQGKGQTIALAGTQSQEESSAEVKQWDDKNRMEQQIVSDYIYEQLVKHTDTITIGKLHTRSAGKLAHLCRTFHFQLSSTEKMAALLLDMHPTPAVCGWPKREVLDFLTQSEGYDRGYYAGFVGWLDGIDNTHLFVNLRCAQLDEEGATLYAGGGILSSSKVNEEWQETENKMLTIKNILREKCTPIKKIIYS